jgi:TonB family protein
MKMKTAAAALTAALILLLSGRQAPAQRGGVQLTGVVIDASTAVVPEAVVLVRNLETRKREITKTNAAGDFSFDGLPPGKYQIEVSKPGFQLYRQENVTIVAGVPQSLNVQLALGRIHETIEVVGSRPSRTVSGTGTPRRIRVGGLVQAAKLVKMVRPPYPAHLKEAGIEGSVLLEAIVGTDGAILNLKAENTIVHPDLVQAAMDAVSQWHYEPTFLNGKPVEITTNVVVNFTLN